MLEDEYLVQLENLRKLMIQTGIEYGLANEKTVNLSHQFDRLMNDYTIAMAEQQNSHQQI